MATVETKSKRLQLRLSEQERATLDQAATVTGTSSSDFIRTAAMHHAEHVLADRTRFVLDAEAWDRFREALEQPAQVKPALVDLFRQPDVFED